MPLPLPDRRTLAAIAEGYTTSPFDVTGHPACSVPAGLVDGAPVGTMIVGRQFDDATVLRTAHAYEQAMGGFPFPPVTAAVSA